MIFGHCIREIGRSPRGGGSLTQDDARQLYVAMLDGGVPDLELGAIILALRAKGESLDEMLGFLAAIDERTNRLELPSGRVRPVVLPTYSGTREEANLTPLLALLLRQFAVPVLVHGLLEGLGRVTTGLIFRELGIMPMASVAQAQARLEEEGLAFLPLNGLNPGAYSLLNLRSRLGVRNSAHSLVKLLNPFAGDAVLVVPATHPEFIELMRAMLLERGQRGLLFRATEGEPFANPRCRPRLEYIHDGMTETLFEAEHETLRVAPDLPAAADAATTARWIRRVVERQIPLPKPLANQLACCLVASGYAEDLCQAKAVVAVGTNGTSAAAA
jgi:anthranilate phosphoribosyltransferase